MCVIFLIFILGLYSFIFKVFYDIGGDYAEIMDDCEGLFDDEDELWKKL